MKYKLLVLIALSGFLVSCEDVFNQRVFIDIDSGPEKLVLLTDFENDNSPRVLLSLSGLDYNNYNNSEGAYKQAPKAEIEVFEDGVSLGKMKNDTLSAYVFSNKYVPKEGKTYEIKVRADGFNEIGAVGTMPKIVPIKAEFTGKTKKVNNYYGEVDAQEVKLTFTDLPNHENYFKLNLNTIVTTTDTSNGYNTMVDIFSNDLIFNSGSSFFGDSEPNRLRRVSSRSLFKDETFSGETKEILIYVSVFIRNKETKEPKVTLLYNLQNLSEDTYKYETTRKLAWDNDGNPFVQPTIIHNNITGGGVGAFNTYAISKGSLQVNY